jgi:hypothetical protein
LFLCLCMTAETLKSSLYSKLYEDFWSGKTYRFGCARPVDNKHAKSLAQLIHNVSTGLRYFAADCDVSAPLPYSVNTLTSFSQS